MLDRAAPEAALARPQTTFDGDDLYDDLPAKAGALLHSLIAKHPFVDGNKRVGVMTTELFLAVNGYRSVAGDGELEGMVFAVAREERAAQEISIWIRQRLVPLDR